MDKYLLKRKADADSENNPDDSSKHIRVEVNLGELPTDPGLRIRILGYSPEIRDDVRREYLLKGPCQPRNHKFPYTLFGSKQRRFNPAWFDEYSTWLEYSVNENAAYCLCCYLYKPIVGNQAGGDTFVGVGFTNWAKKERLRIHVGGVNSAHNQAWGKCEALLKKHQHTEIVVFKHLDQSEIDYKICLVASIDCIRFLSRQGLAFQFRSHDECEASNNKGNFLELLQFLADHTESVEADTVKNASWNLKLTSSDIQKDILNAVVTETTKLIVSDFCDDLFAILIDVSYDVSAKAQLSVVVRYVDTKGHIIERFLGIEHVPNTTAISLKATLDDLLVRHGLSISKLRGQSYYRASDMQDEIGGLKTLILNENKNAYYVHCFAHQLQLTLVVAAKKHLKITGLFCILNNVVKVVGGSCKCLGQLPKDQAAKVIELLELGEIVSGQGLNQENALVRVDETRWRSHFDALVGMTLLFSFVIDVLEMIEEDGLTIEQKYAANELSKSLQTFDFIFSLHLMVDILGITSELSEALQKKEQDIVNAMNLVRVCKDELQKMRVGGWDPLYKRVSLFCEKHDVDVCNMDQMCSLLGRSHGKTPQMTNLHYYRVELFEAVIDLQRMELENCFSEIGIELLLSMACLNPSNSFCAFDKSKLIDLARFYPNDFSEKDLMILDDQLETYVVDVKTTIEYSNLQGISDLAQKMVETGRDEVYPLVYLLIKLAMILPVATASIERAFTAIDVVKNRLVDEMGEEWTKNSLVTYIERDVFAEVDNENIIDTFHKMQIRGGS